MFSVDLVKEGDKEYIYMKVFGVQFAPLLIPWERRMQTLAVFLWIGSFLFMGPLTLLLFYYFFFYTRFAFIPVLYLAWYIADRRTPCSGGRRNNWVRSWKLWKYYAQYFPIELVKEADLDPRHNYIIGSHPHGILCSGAFGCFASEALNIKEVYPGVTFYLTTLDCQFLPPLYREYFLCSGAISATRPSLNHVLGTTPSGQAIVLIVGGAPESLDTHPNSDVITLILNNRKGFIKLAFQHGAHLVPSFSFGENDVYNQVNNPRGSYLRKIQDTLQHVIGLAPVIFRGRGIFQYNFGIIPYRRHITTVVGKPIPVPKVEKPSPEQIEELHARYVNALVDLVERNKSKYASNPKMALQIL